MLFKLHQKSNGLSRHLQNPQSKQQLLFNNPWDFPPKIYNTIGHKAILNKYRKKIKEFYVF